MTVRQGHVTIQFTFPISGTIRARTMIFFFVSSAFRVRKVNGITNRRVEFTRDLVRYSTSRSRDYTIVWSRDLDVQGQV